MRPRVAGWRVSTDALVKEALDRPDYMARVNADLWVPVPVQIELIRDNLDDLLPIMREDVFQRFGRSAYVCPWVCGEVEIVSRLNARFPLGLQLFFWRGVFAWKNRRFLTFLFQQVRARALDRYPTSLSCAKSLSTPEGSGLTKS